MVGVPLSSIAQISSKRLKPPQKTVGFFWDWKQVHKNAVVKSVSGQPRSPTHNIIITTLTKCSIFLSENGFDWSSISNKPFIAGAAARFVSGWLKTLKAYIMYSHMFIWTEPLPGNPSFIPRDVCSPPLVTVILPNLASILSIILLSTLVERCVRQLRPTHHAIMHCLPLITFLATHLSYGFSLKPMWLSTTVVQI